MQDAKKKKKKKNKKHWISKAIKNPGSLTKKAKAKGQTVEQFCKTKKKDPTTQKQCNLYKTLKKMRKKKK